MPTGNNKSIPRSLGQTAGLLLAATLASGAAYAAPITFYGQDQNPPNSTANSDQAHSDFLNSLSGIATEDFESFNGYESAPITLTFPGSSGTLTANLQGNGDVKSYNSSGAHATSGDNYYLAITGNTGNEFHIDFSSSPISAFGFYGTDISDSGSLFFLQLTDTDNNTQKIQVTQDRHLNSYNQLFWGFVDPDKSYTDISFLSDSSGDYFGFDDMTIGDSGQVTNPPTVGVPEPSGLLLLGSALLGLGFLRRAKNRKNDC